MSIHSKDKGTQNNLLKNLQNQLEGTLHFDKMMRILYATDASVYRELPLAVACPKNVADLKKLISFATQNQTSLIPRTAGTSLAGQCVGKGIVVDVSKHFTEIIELNIEEKWVKVQPGVIRDELNLFLKPHDLFFAPDTSTSNRCMIGGMVGNNSCGTTSVKYGTTRDYVLELKTLLSDGSEATFSELSKENFHLKTQKNDLEGKIYQQIDQILSNEDNQIEIITEFPKEEVTRRNTGYALDELLYSNVFSDDDEANFNFCKLLCGSEGTLAFTTEIKLQLTPLPPQNKALVCVHFHSLKESLQATTFAVKLAPEKVELMDDLVLDCTKTSIEYSKYRDFLVDEPKAVLCVEFAEKTEEELKEKCQKLENILSENELGYAFPVVKNEKITQVWALRKAGLGLLANVKGDAKAVAVIEDTAVAVEDLPDYIEDFGEILKKYDKKAVHYAHAGAGELHLRPLLNLKEEKDRQIFRKIGQETAELVKKYEGANSGEHGDGRVRGEFLPMLVGEKNYQLFKEIKKTWDENGIFNPNKIVETPPMDTDFRYENNQKTKQFNTVFNFDAEGGILRMTEKCNGSGDCRKSHLSGGTMCPSFMATRNEKDSTRARANILREFLTRNNEQNPFAHPEVKEVMDLCVSCKGCTSECPSNVDMSTLKSEFQYQYNLKNGVPFRSKIFANIAKYSKMGANFPSLNNWFLTGTFSGLIKKTLNIAPQRTLPTLHKTTLTSWFKKNKTRLKPTDPKGKIYFFNDEFTNYQDTEIGIKAIEVLSKLGYEVKIPNHVESGRAQISKGLLKEAQKLAKQNVNFLKNIISEETPLVGIEPSAILSFRDEYVRLVDKNEQENAKSLGKNTLILDEFLAKEIEKGHISSENFTKNTKKILIHGHCHQKALSSVDFTAWMLGLPENYEVEIIPSGCCGMAGSFGYEAEHYEVSMKMGDLVLFPAVKNAERDTIIVAVGTSCRHQIADGTQRKAIHPIEVWHEALK